MTRRNRIAPNGDIIAHPARGCLTGNRGCLHDASGQMTGRRWASKAWISCLLDYKNRAREINPPGCWTQLFFADDLVALSAGHRPCHTCRRSEYYRFQQAFGAANPKLGPKPKAPKIDEALHVTRITQDTRQKKTFDLPLNQVPEGAFFLREHDVMPHMKWQGLLLQWSFERMVPVVAPQNERIAVLTPKPVTRMLAQGYLPQFLP